LLAGRSARIAFAKALADFASFFGIQVLAID
jgi:hypothetical protein